MNLPPFYVGQKVVALKSSMNMEIVKGSVYTIAGMFHCGHCRRWMVCLKEFPHPKVDWWCCELRNVPGYRGGPAAYFVPALENFQSITLEKVLEQETKLVSVN